MMVGTRTKMICIDSPNSLATSSERCDSVSDHIHSAPWSRFSRPSPANPVLPEDFLNLQSVLNKEPSSQSQASTIQKLSKNFKGAGAGADRLPENFPLFAE